MNIITAKQMKQFVLMINVRQHLTTHSSSCCLLDDDNADDDDNRRKNHIDMHMQKKSCRPAIGTRRCKDYVSKNWTRLRIMHQHQNLISLQNLLNTEAIRKHTKPRFESEWYFAKSKDRQIGYGKTFANDMQNGFEPVIRYTCVRVFGIWHSVRLRLKFDYLFLSALLADIYTCVFGTATASASTNFLINFIFSYTT